MPTATVINHTTLAPAATPNAATLAFIATYPVMGQVRVTACDAGLIALDFIDHAKHADTPRGAASLDNSQAAHHLKEAADWLASYAATGTPPELPALAPRGTTFQRQVWETLARFKVGQILSYRELGALVGRPTAARCVGGAVGRNPLPVMIPCHRVLAANGHLGGYSGGLERKRLLLRHEGLGWRE